MRYVTKDCTPLGFLFLACIFLFPAAGLAQLDKRPDLAPDLKSNERKEEEDTKTDKNPLPMPGTTMTDERKKQIGEAMKDRPMTMDADKMRAGMRRQNLDYKILMVGSLTAQKAIAYGMQLRLSVQVKVDGAAPEDRVLFYVGLGASGSNEPIVTSERFEGQGPGPHIVSLVVPVEEPLVVDEGRLQADLFLLSEKLMPGLPGKQIVLKQPMQDKDPSNNRKALNYNVQQPEISLARVSRKGTNLDTVKVGERVELVVQARVTNGGTARNAITYAIGDPGTGRIDSAGPKVFHQGDGLTQEATVAFRVTPEQIVDGELRTTLFLLRNSEPSAPFAERLHTDSNPSDDRQIIRYPLWTTPKGYVLTHEHPTYGMAFGGNYAFAGKAGNYRHGIMQDGYTAECGGCSTFENCDHGEVKGNLVGWIDAMGRDMEDHFPMMGPYYDSFSHLRYSTEWIEEAFRPSETAYQNARMRIMVALAVENEAMCEQLYYVNKGNGGPGGDGFACSRGDSFASLKRQLDNLKAWADDNSSWMEIAYNAADARRIVNEDKLAVILGIEAEYAFGAENRTFDPVERLNTYYDEGVRTFYLAHKINSRLAGADIFYPANTNPGKAIRTTQAIAGCFYYDDNVGHFPLEGRLGKNLCDNKNRCGANAFRGGKVTDACAHKLSDISEVNMSDYLLTRGKGQFNGFALYPETPGFDSKGGSRTDNHGIERNNLGLSHEGERVVREAMIKGMIVNIDHVSSLARDKMYELATEVFGDYPLNALHNKPNDRLTNKKKKYWKHEYDIDSDELSYIKNTGGFFGLRMGPTDSVEYAKSGITVDCKDTSTESAKMLAWLIDQGIDVGYALDYATTTEGVYARSFTNCGLDELGKDYFHVYGKHRTGGLSHIGMMKKWHAELEAIGLKQHYVDQLRDDGVEAFLKMWEKSEAASGSGSQIDRIRIIPQVEPH